VGALQACGRAPSGPWVVVQVKLRGAVGVRLADGQGRQQGLELDERQVQPQPRALAWASLPG
jgi:hypothetical protein